MEILPLIGFCLLFGHFCFLRLVEQGSFWFSAEQALRRERAVWRKKKKKKSGGGGDKLHEENENEKKKQRLKEENFRI